ncbi:Palmitoyl-acyl carrier protein thioesterase, chloroplastic [Morella rubra]|uniref:Acyl-[acyl-carrier-protein] hydrolase n=1 Tax=Morella rubra TaxID=262757 RepID=A0A6A1UKQ6_9ROSI|nr:Palmitoyl-acyl carrier protein thioesterase, chloroplastic [Morella rubra]
MVAIAATCAFFPAASPAPDSRAKPAPKLLNFGGMKSKSAEASGGFQVKTNADAHAKINGTEVRFTTPSDIDMDLFGSGRLDQNGLVFRQNFLIRSYEVVADGTSSLETLMNHLQEASINHGKSLGLVGEGFGATPGMSKKNLMWVVKRTQVVVDRYPTWGDAVQVQGWFHMSGRNGLRRDSLFRDSKTGETLARASSLYVLVNKQTRQLSKMPEEVRLELEPYFLDSNSIAEEDSRKLQEPGENETDFVRAGFTTRWNDLDANQHVNNVKYVGWILESAPVKIMESHEVSAMTLEYKRECGKDYLLQSLTTVSRNSVGNLAVIKCQHLLGLEDGEEILRGRTHARCLVPAVEMQEQEEILFYMGPVVQAGDAGHPRRGCRTLRWECGWSSGDKDKVGVPVKKDARGGEQGEQQTLKL